MDLREYVREIFDNYCNGTITVQSFHQSLGSNALRTALPSIVRITICYPARFEFDPLMKFIDEHLDTNTRYMCYLAVFTVSKDDDQLIEFFEKLRSIQCWLDCTIDPLLVVRNAPQQQLERVARVLNTHTHQAVNDYFLHAKDEEFFNNVGIALVKTEDDERMEMWKMIFLYGSDEQSECKTEKYKRAYSRLMRCISSNN